MWEILSKAVGSGWRTSEFWVSVLALTLPVADAAASNAHGAVGVIGGAIVAGAYSISRALTKKAAIEAAAPQAASEAAAMYVDDKARRDQAAGLPVTGFGVDRR